MATDLGTVYNEKDTICRAIGQDDDGTIRGTEFRALPKGEDEGNLHIHATEVFETRAQAYRWQHEIVGPTTVTAHRDEWAKNEFEGITDRELQDRHFYLDADIIENDSRDLWEARQEDRWQAMRLLRAMWYELGRRARTGERVGEPLNIEEELAPFGPEWEREQEERMMFSTY